MSLTTFSAVGGFVSLLGIAVLVAWLTFNMAHAKHSNRKDLVREDVRTIESAFDRAMLLPAGESRVVHRDRPGSSTTGRSTDRPRPDDAEAPRR